MKNLQPMNVDTCPAPVDNIVAFGQRFRKARLWWLITFPITLVIASLGLLVGIVLKVGYERDGIAVVLLIWCGAVLINWSAW